jgi:FKBP-type peptidyl-prolyl cis-trans isomerase FklB
MKKCLIGLALAIAVVQSAMAAEPSSSRATKISTEKDKLSYTIGADIGTNFKKQGVEVNADLMMRGYQDAVSGGKLLMTQQEMADTLNNFQNKLSAKQADEYKTIAVRNKQEGEDFLAKNKQKEGVVSLENGLQYKVVTAGTGAKPGPQDTVTVEYTGKLIDGTVFDTTEKTGKPATFKVSDVIPGWTQALQLMSSGSTWDVYIPSELAYGERGVGGPIGPNQTLLFSIHLISVEKTKAGEKVQSSAKEEEGEE